MVIISTSAVEVSIQAVSPALILSVPTSTGSVGAGGVLEASAAGAAASAPAGAAVADAAAGGESAAVAAGVV